MPSSRQIWIDEAARRLPFAERLVEHVDPDAIRFVKGREQAIALSDQLTRERAKTVKRSLFVTSEKGRFLRPCPGTPQMKCCNLFVLNPVVGCPYDCSYCFLQAYQAEPFITVYANIEEMVSEVERLIRVNQGRVVRICVGELADALALEPVAEMAAFLVRRFAQWDSALLELKTKSTEVDSLLSLDHNNRTVISWTLNSAAVSSSEEKGAPGPMKRLQAASAVTDAGYPVAFHFDPLVRTEGWKDEYAALVDELFRAVPADRIRWISLGGFRYFPAMKPVIKERSPGTRLFLGEFLPCPDGKYRYYLKHRIELYREMLTRIRKHSHDTPVYLCMEADHVWRKVFGSLPEELPELELIYGDRNFDESR